MPKPISISLGAAKPKKPTHAQEQTKKRPAANLDSDIDDDDHHHDRGRKVLVTAFDAALGGAIGEGGVREEEGPLVIATIGNRDWRAEAEKRRGGKAVWLPPESTAGKRKGKGEEVEVDTGAGEKYGLQVFERRTSSNDGDEHPAGTAAVASAVEKTEDQRALEALLSTDSKPTSTLVLPSAADEDWREREEHAFKSDVASRPDVPTLDDYAAVPVEEFGAALLRGMGWREGMELGKRGGKQGKLRSVEKRPAFLGIGAKAKEEVPELGVWGLGDKKGKGRGRGRVDTTYVPVVLVDRRTGRVVEEGGADRDTGREKERRRGKEDRRDREHSYDDSERRRRRDRSRDGYHERDRDRDRDRHGRNGEKHRDRDREDRGRRSRDDRRSDDRDRRRRSRDRYEKRDRR